jgi:ATP-dependent Clp protease ATP-binding subunit ClpA
MRSREVCTEHVLLALANEKGSVAEAAMTELGATPERIRAELARMPKKSEPAEVRKTAN